MKRRAFMIGGMIVGGMIGGGAIMTFPRDVFANQPDFPAPSGAPNAPFDDLNFKLAILAALEEQGLISFGTPPQLAEHVLGRKFDMSNEGYKPVPAVLDYLARYPLTPQMLDELQILNLDGGSMIYHHIWHFWHGEDNTFDIRNLVGIEHCRNLRELNVASMVPVVDIALLAPLRHLEDLYIGVDVANIAALDDMSSLKSVRILDDETYAQVMTPGHETRQVMDRLKARGVKVWVHWVSNEAQPPAFE